MGLVTEIAKFARLGNIEAINRALDENRHNAHAILLGRIAADQAMHRDPPLPQLAADPLPAIAAYNAGPQSWGRKSRKRLKAA